MAKLVRPLDWAACLSHSDADSSSPPVCLCQNLDISGLAQVKALALLRQSCLIRESCGSGGTGRRVSGRNSVRNAVSFAENSGQAMGDCEGCTWSEPSQS